MRRLALGRDVDAWTAIVSLHGAEILGVARRILNDAALAEDACQETLLQVRDKAGQFKGRRALIPGLSPRPSASDDDAAARNWIMRIACNTSLHLLRQRRRALARENVPMKNTVVVDTQERDELVELVRGELAELPESQRLPLMLHFFGGLDYAQLATELRCGVNASKARVHRALKKLRERLAMLGIVVTSAALYTLLHTTPAWAADAVLNPERAAQWQNLLFSSRQAAVDVLSDERLPMMAKLGYCAATAALCGSLAVTSAQRNTPESPKPVQPAAMAAPVPKPEVQTAPARVEIPTEVTDTPETKKARKAAGPARISTGYTSYRPLKLESDGGKPLVSPLAQLRMLQKIQHDVNMRVVKVHLDAQTAEAQGSELSIEQKEQLRRASEDQAAIAELVEHVAEEIRRDGEIRNLGD